MKTLYCSSVAITLLILASQQLCNVECTPITCTPPEQDAQDKVCNCTATECEFELVIDRLPPSFPNLHRDVLTKGIAVNGHFHGPTLIVDEGAYVKVRVVNQYSSNSTNSTTVHWHGLHQRGTPWMDGVENISHPSILPGDSFDYVFKAEQAGTHWYHSHAHDHRTLGLFGALIVREMGNITFARNVTQTILSYFNREGLSMAAGVQTINDFPDRHTLTLLDWKHNSTEPEVWSGLINGRGRFNPLATVGTSIVTDLSVFTVSRNSVNRFRVIGAQHTNGYYLSIDNHKLHVIATDGIFFEPVTVDYLFVHSGERYDFIVETFNQQEMEFWIRADTVLPSSTVGKEHSALAVLNYGEARPFRSDSV